ncbi:MAG: immunoglobulin-like domain-containing protein [Clostridia bacterium]
MKDKRKIFYIIIIVIVIICIGIYIIINQDLNKIENKTINNLTNTIIENIENEQSVDNVSMYVKKDSITPKGAIIVIEDKNSQFFTYSDGYFIEVLKDDQWIKLNETEKFWNDFVYVPDENGILSMQLDWTKKYGALENNKYRIGMIIGNEQIQDNIYAEFEIK